MFDLVAILNRWNDEERSVDGRTDKCGIGNSMSLEREGF